MPERRLAPRPGEAGKRNNPGPYTVYELVRIEVAGRCLGHNKHSETWGWLTSDFALRFRRTFGFDMPRANRGGGRPPKMTAGIPSISTLGRYRREWFIETERAEAFRALHSAGVDEEIRVDPEGMRKEAECLVADGSVKETHHTCPRKKDGVVVNRFRTDWKTGELVPNITCPEGGFLPNKGHNATHSGEGFNYVNVMTLGGTTLPGWDLIPINDDERDELVNQTPGIEDYLKRVGVPDDIIPLLTADPGFHSHVARPALHDIGVIENISIASHGPSDRTDANVEKRNRQKILINGHPKWYADGHRQLHCECGHAKLARKVHRKKRGISVCVEGDCKGADGKGGCGFISITAGRWHLPKSAKMFRLGRAGEDRDWSFGNFLTHGDDIAKQFGDARHSFQEGFYGSQLTRRFNALMKRWIRRKTQAEIDIGISLCVLNAISLRERRRKLANASSAATGDPPVALAA